MASIKHTWINSLVIASAKSGHICTGTTLSMLKIYSRCLIHIFKTQITEFKISDFTTFSSAKLRTCLP